MAKYEQVFVAEKPSLAKAIVAGLGGKSESFDGYWVVDGKIAVTNAFGHMLELAPPEYYNPAHKKWDVAHTPYNPNTWVLLPKPSAEKQLKIVGKLLSETNCAVNAGDPDREGQMLVDELFEYFNFKGKTQRILPNAVDLDSIKKALAGIRDNSIYLPLFHSANCRSRADWITGLSWTVAATKLLATDSLISLGRVQTPTLGLVVRRDLEIENFVSREFFNLTASVKAAGVLLEMSHAPMDESVRIYVKSDAERIASEVKSKAIYELNVTEKEASESANFPFHLESLQKECGDVLGLNSADVLKIAQSLYEKGVTSYPRTDCHFLPDEQKSQAVSIANKVIAAGYFPESKQFSNLLAPSHIIYNTKKAPVHHAIVPTAKMPAGLSGDEESVYNLIVRRYILSLMPDYKFKETRVTFIHDGREFSAKGEVPINLDKSWRALSPKANAPVALPIIADKTQGKVEDVVISKGKTTPPRPYTEGDLLVDMSNVAKYVDDPKIKAILKESAGIGTPATKATVLATLKARGYIEVVNGSGDSEGGKGKRSKKPILRSTQFGREVIAAVPAQLRDPGLTAVWEESLKEIAAGRFDKDVFMTKIVNFTAKRIEEMKTSTVLVTAKPVKQVTTASLLPGPKKRGANTASSTRSRKEQPSQASQREA